MGSEESESVISCRALKASNGEKENKNEHRIELNSSIEVIELSDSSHEE